jgi:two-component system LytT family response regulator
MLKCYIIDDESHAINILKNFIEDHQDLMLLGYDQDSLEGLQKVKKLVPDILFLDINMPKINGIILSSLIDPLQTKVVFTTAFSHYALDAFENMAFDYILKPISYERFEKCIANIKASLLNDRNVTETATQDDFIFIKTDNKGKIIKVNYDSIYYIESSNNYVVFKLANARYITYVTLKEVIQQLPPNLFLRVHKSFIINQNKIDFINGNQIILNDKTNIQLGVTYRDEFFKAVDSRLIKTGR